MDGSRGVQKSRNKSVRRKLNYSVNENCRFFITSRVTRLDTRKEGNRYVERVLSLLRAANEVD